MSMSLMAKAMGVKVGNSLRKLVLLKLADNANDKGECWPSYQHIADHCECSRSAVRTHIDALETMGILRRENRLGVNNGKGNTSNVYYLMLDTPVPPESIAPMPSKSTGLCQQKAQAMPAESIPLCQQVAPEPVTLEPVIKHTPKSPKGAKFDPMSVDIPEWLNPTAWAEWVDYRKASGKAIKTALTVTKAFALLQDCYESGYDPIEIINTSIANQYQGLFKPKYPPAPQQVPAAVDWNTRDAWENEFL